MYPSDIEKMENKIIQRFLQFHNNFSVKGWQKNWFFDTAYLKNANTS